MAGAEVRTLRVVPKEQQGLTDHDWRWMKATLRHAARVIERHEPHEYQASTRLRKLADAIERDEIRRTE